MKRIVCPAVGLVLFTASVLAVTDLVQYSRNTLARNGRWVNAKLLMQVPLTGAAHFMYTRNALHRNRLNLQAWHGQNEIDLNEVFAPGRIEVRFLMEPKSYLNVLFNRDERGYDGLRLSRAESLPSLFFRSDRRGRFTERRAFGDGTAELIPEGWHDLDLRFHRERLQVLLDGRQVMDEAVEGKPRQFVGLRGGLGAVMVDSLRVRDAEGRSVIDESFRNTRGVAGVLMAVTAALLALCALTIRLAERRPGDRGRRGVKVVMIAGANLLAVTLLLYGFDYFVWSGRYANCEMFPQESVGSPSLECRLEGLRTRLFAVERLPDRRGDLLRRLALRPLLASSITGWDGSRTVPFGGIQVFSGGGPVRVVDEDELRPVTSGRRKVFRIAWLGTSQTVGVGAERVEDTFVAVAHRLLSPRLKGEKKLESYNLSIPGGTSEGLLERCRRVWSAIKPDLVMVNLSNNDDRHSLGPNLRRMLDFNDGHGVATVFLLEANCTEESNAELLQKHRIVREVASQGKRPCWDLHGWLGGEPILDSGHLWWDGVHLTSWGQEAAGEWLAGKIAFSFPGDFP